MTIKAHYITGPFAALAFITVWLFAAQFALDELQSWGRALFEARYAPVFGIALGVSLFRNHKNQPWKETLLTVLILLSSFAAGILVYANTFASIPREVIEIIGEGARKFAAEKWTCIGGLTFLNLIGAVSLEHFLLKALSQETQQCEIKLAGDPSKN